MNSVDVRAELVRALRLDLIGPEPADEACAREALPQTPSQWYLTGFLVPYEADASEREDETSNEQLDLVVAGSGDDEATPDPASARKAFLPSSLGVSLLVRPGARALQVAVTWGDYRYVPSPRASLHAKGVVVDDTRAFVTSANFTEAAHDRNIEAGVLVESVSFATSMRRQFESLVECGLLRKLPAA